MKIEIHSPPPITNVLQVVKKVDALALAQQAQLYQPVKLATNELLSNAHVSDEWKTAIVKPLLKKSGLE